MERTIDEQGNLVLEFTLPCVPPSVNHYYGNRAFGKRVIRYITSKGKAFREIVKRTVNVDTILTRRLILTIIYAYTDRRRHDVDNPNKAILDALNGILYVDDEQITTLEVHKIKSESGFAYTKVKVTELKADKR